MEELCIHLTQQGRGPRAGMYGAVAAVDARGVTKQENDVYSGTSLYGHLVKRSPTI